MADIKFSEFPKANQSKDSDEIAILQDGVNKMISSPILESKIINKTVSRVIDQGDASFNLINPIGVVPTYADLALITPTPELNDAYQVEADGLVYVYTESGFQAEGEGFKVQLEPTGVVEEGNTEAVSGGEVYEVTSLVTPTYEEIVNKSTNLFNPDFLLENTVVGSTGNVITSPGYTNALTIKLPVSELDLVDKPFTVSNHKPNAGCYVVHKDSSNQTVGTMTQLNLTVKTITPPIGAVDTFIYVRLNSDSDPLPTDIMINEGSTALPYEPYFDTTIDILGIKELGGEEIIAKTLKDGNQIPQSNNPQGAVNRTEMEVYVSENSGSGEAYDQQLNTTDNVVFNSVEAGQITTSVLVANLPTDSSEVDSGEVWIDISNGNVLKVK